MTTLLFFLLFQRNIIRITWSICMLSVIIRPMPKSTQFTFHILFPYQLKKLYSITTGDFVKQFVAFLQL